LSNTGCATKFGYLFPGGSIHDICLLNGDHPSVLMIGDSHAIELFAGMVDFGVTNLLILGKGSCAPLMGDPKDRWLKCQPTQHNILSFAVQSDFQLVVLTGVFERYFDGTYQIDHASMEEDIQRSFAMLSDRSSRGVHLQKRMIGDALLISTGMAIRNNLDLLAFGHSAGAVIKSILRSHVPHGRHCNSWEKAVKAGPA
jgi:hypothetical protein